MAAVHGHLLFGNLTVQGRIGPQQQLLPGLTAGVECTGNLGAAKRTVVQHSTVIPGKRHTLRDALIDDGGTDFGQPMNVGFAGSVIPPLDGIIEQTINGIPVVLVIFGRVDPPLRCNTVGPAW